jgi:hypothetical protein
MTQFKIPRQVVEYKEGEMPDAVPYEDLKYEPTDGEVIDVRLWCRWSCYDFIFGVPAKDSPKYALEVGFFQYRDTRLKTVPVGMYVDIVELEALVEGFSKLLEASKENSPHLWQKNKTEQERIQEGQTARG